MFDYFFVYSHEIPPPLHQRRTLQMTRKENEGFGFVLQVGLRTFLYYTEILLSQNS